MSIIYLNKNILVKEYLFVLTIALNAVICSEEGYALSSDWHPQCRLTPSRRPNSVGSIGCHLRAIEHFGARPEMVVYDNLKNIVLGFDERGLSYSTNGQDIKNGIEIN
jgi:hypothetical protein